MGVQGFTSYFKGKSGQAISISSIAKNKDITIGIDGNALIYHIGSSSFSSIGSYIHLKEDILKFFKPFTLHNINLIVFMDGLTPPGKHAELEKRYESKLKDIQEVSDNLKNNVDFPFSKPLVSKLQMNLFKETLKELNIPVHLSFQESDNEMKQWVVDNPNKVFGLISNDSDFFFFKLGDCYYFPLAQLTISPDNIIGVGFKSNLTAESLKITEKYLPILATIIGNDYTKHLNTRFKGFGYKRIDAIVRQMQQYKGQSIESILKDNFIGINKGGKDLETCIDSYLYYVPKVGGTQNEEDGYWKDNFFFRYSQHPDFQFVKEKPFYDYIFSVDCESNYNQLSFIRSNNQLTSVLGYQSSDIRYHESFYNYSSNIRQKLFGLLSFELKDNSKYDELVQDGNYKYLKISTQPILGEFGIDACWKNQVNYKTRLNLFCSTFISDKQLSKELTKNYLDQPKLDNLLIILFTKYLLSLKDKLDIKIWMIDSLLLHFVFLKLNVKMDRDDIDVLKQQNYKAIIVFDYYQSLMGWGLTMLDVLNIIHRTSPIDQVMDCINYQILFKTALSNSSKLSNTTQGDVQKRFNILFPDLEEDYDDIDLITNYYLELANCVFNDEIPDNRILEPTTTTTTTTTTTITTKEELPDMNNLSISCTNSD